MPDPFDKQSTTITMDIDSTVMGVNLAKLRAKHGYTLPQLSVMIDNRKAASIASWEQGNATPSIKTLVKLCKIYGVTPNDILGFDDE